MWQPPLSTSACPPISSPSSTGDRHHRALPHPDRDPARRPRRPRHLRPGPDRLGQDPRLRPPAGGQGRRPALGRPRALVLVPTRELAAQVTRELEPSWPRRRALASRRVYGGVGYGPQRPRAARGADIVVACPGRLEDLVAAARPSSSTTSTSSCSTRPTGWPTWASCPPSSASSTQPRRPPDAAVLGHPRRRRRRPDPPATSATPRRPRASTVPTTTPHVAPLLLVRPSAAERVGLTAGWSPPRPGHRVLPDQARRRPAHPPARRARRDGRRHPRQPHPGPAPAGPRRFAAGRAQALVATDVAARGIHVDAVACVVHFDPPADDKDYLHRSGRTGRAGATAPSSPSSPRTSGKRWRPCGGPSGWATPSSDAPELPGPPRRVGDAAHAAPDADRR